TLAAGQIGVGERNVLAGRLAGADVPVDELAEARGLAVRVVPPGLHRGHDLAFQLGEIARSPRPGKPACDELGRAGAVLPDPADDVADSPEPETGVEETWQKSARAASPGSPFEL